MSPIEPMLDVIRWECGAGMESLGDLPGGVHEGYGLATNQDGSVIVGRGGSTSNLREAFRWTVSEGLVPLGVPSGMRFSQAQGVSADGDVIVGYFSSSSGAQTGFRWTQDAGMVGLGGLNGAPNGSTANGISADGLVIVGAASNLACIWTEPDGIVSLGDLPGGSAHSQAFAASADGEVVVGFGFSDAGRRAFRWTESDGMQELPTSVDGVIPQIAYAVSADGAVIVGHAGIPGPGGVGAFIWQQGIGTRSLSDVLTVDFGVDLSGWQLGPAVGISSDGTIITGDGQNAQGDIEAWIARLEGVHPCRSDTTGDNRVNTADFNVLALHFGQHFPVCLDSYLNGDLNDDGVVSSADFSILAGDFGCGAE